jgi:DNA-binding CsgD family transcriptional regulator
MVKRRVVVALMLGIAALAVPPQVDPARADNIGGLFEECAQLVEFVAPSGSDDGHLTLVGIGPGLYNAIGDETHHRFPFGPDISISSTLASRLTTLANRDSFTCLRMTGDGMGLIIAVALDSQVQVCGTIARNTSGIFSINRPADFVHMELVAEAGTIVDKDRALSRTLTEVANSQYATCLNFQLDGVGLIESITVDALFSACGRIQNQDNLVVGSFIVANVGSTSGALIPEPAITVALVVLPRLGSEGCVQVTVASSRINEALLDAGDMVCGLVVFPDIGDVEINEVSIPRSLLTSAQLADLRLAAGGTACLSISVSANRYASSLTTIPPTPSPVPSASLSPTPSASPATPSATPREEVAPPTENDGPPTGLMLGLMGASALGLGSIGYVVWRRRQGGGPAPIGGVPGDQPTAPIVMPGDIAPFTPREQEVLGMLYEGMSNKEIGSRLFITESTAGVHVSNIMMKLGAKSRAEAAALAHRMGLTSFDGPQH